MALINCPECGKEISDRALSCPNCGCPIASVDQPVGTGSASAQTPEAPVDIPVNQSPSDEQKSPIYEKANEVEKAVKSKTGIIIAVIAIAVVVIAAILISGAVKDAREKKAAEEAAAAAAAARDEYIENLNTIRFDMLMAAADAEDAAGLIHDVWYNTIYEKSNSETNKYTIKSSKYSSSKSSYSDSDFNDDFNTSLTYLFIDAEFIEKQASIESQCDDIASLYGKMQNPPDDLSACYATLGDLYDAFLALTGCATDPSGNLNSYTSTLNEADSDFINYYDKLGAMIPTSEVVEDSTEE